MLRRRRVLIGFAVLTLSLVGIAPTYADFGNEPPEHCSYAYSTDIVNCFEDCYGNFWVCCWDWHHWCFKWYCVEDLWSSGGHPGTARVAYPQPIPWYGSLIQLSRAGGDKQPYMQYEFEGVIASSVPLAVDTFLQIDGVPSESTDDKHADWIEVLW